MRCRQTEKSRRLIGTRRRDDRHPHGALTDGASKRFRIDFLHDRLLYDGAGIQASPYFAREVHELRQFSRRDRPRSRQIHDNLTHDPPGRGDMIQDAVGEIHRFEMLWVMNRTVF